MIWLEPIARTLILNGPAVLLAIFVVGCLDQFAVLCRIRSVPRAERSLRPINPFQRGLEIVAEPSFARSSRDIFAGILPGVLVFLALAMLGVIPFGPPLSVTDEAAPLALLTLPGLTHGLLWFFVFDALFRTLCCYSPNAAEHSNLSRRHIVALYSFAMVIGSMVFFGGTANVSEIVALQAHGGIWWGLLQPLAAVGFAAAFVGSSDLPGQAGNSSDGAGDGGLLAIAKSLRLIAHVMLFALLFLGGWNVEWAPAETLWLLSLAVFWLKATLVLGVAIFLRWLSIRAVDTLRCGWLQTSLPYALATHLVFVASYRVFSQHLSPVILYSGCWTILVLWLAGIVYSRSRFFAAHT